MSGERISEESRDWFADRPIRLANPLQKIAKYWFNRWVTGRDKPLHRVEIVLVARQKLTKLTTVLPQRIVFGTVLIAHGSRSLAFRVSELLPPPPTKLQQE